jgi:hypothetical protein
MITQTLDQLKPRRDLCGVRAKEIDEARHRGRSTDIENCPQFRHLDVSRQDMRDNAGLEFDIFACYFDGNKAAKGNHNSADVYAKCLDAFRRSAGQNSGAANIRIVERDPNEIDNSNGNAWWASNLLKSDTWASMAADMVRPTVFMDVDIIILGNLANGFQRDITITRRASNSWFNSGAVWAMPTPEVKDVFTRWHETAVHLYQHPAELRAASRMHVGLHQTSFIKMLIAGDIWPSVGVLPGDHWNATRACWSNVGTATRVIHATKKLRLEIFADRDPVQWSRAVKEYRKWIQ